MDIAGGMLIALAVWYVGDKIAGALRYSADIRAARLPRILVYAGTYGLGDTIPAAIDEKTIGIVATVSEAAGRQVLELGPTFKAASGKAKGEIVQYA